MILSKAEFVCEECGLVSIDEEPDFKFSYYTRNPDPNQSFRIPEQFVSLGNLIDNPFLLGSLIDGMNQSPYEDYKKQTISIKNQYTFVKLKKYEKTSIRGPTFSRYYRILRLLREYCVNYDIPESIQKRAAYLYAKIRNQSSERNHVRAIAACLYLAIHEYRICFISIEHLILNFCELSYRLNRRLLLRSVRNIQYLLKLKIQQFTCDDYIRIYVKQIYSSPNVLNQFKFKRFPFNIPKYMSQIEYIALDFAKKYRLKYLGLNPRNLACAIIYASDKTLTRFLNIRKILAYELIGDLLHISDFSIRDVFKLKLNKDYFFSKYFFKYHRGITQCQLN